MGRAKKITPKQLRKLRAKFGFNQTQFWARLGVSQSGGSRYESGRSLPPPVRLILGHTYLNQTLPQYGGK